MNAFRALFVRDFLVARSYRLAVALEVGVGLLDLLFYFLIARTFKGVTPTDLGPAPSYFAFAAIGVAMITVLNAATAAVAARMREEQLTGTLEATLSQPVRAPVLAVGMSGLPFVAGTVRAAIYLLLAVLLLDLSFPEADWLGAGAVLGMSGLALSSFGIASAAMILVVKRGDVFASFGVFAIGLVSGAYFPVSVLPGWLEAIAKVLPPFFSFQGLRSALFGGSGWGDDVLVLGLFAVALLPASLWAFGAALKAAKRSGTISEY